MPSTWQVCLPSLTLMDCYYCRPRCLWLVSISTTISTTNFFRCQLATSSSTRHKARTRARTQPAAHILLPAPSPAASTAVVPKLLEAPKIAPTSRFTEAKLKLMPYRASPNKFRPQSPRASSIFATSKALTTDNNSTSNTLPTDHAQTDCPPDTPKTNTQIQH